MSTIVRTRAEQTITAPERCPQCKGHGPIVVWMRCHGDPMPMVETCPGCGRPGLLVQVVYTKPGRA